MYALVAASIYSQRVNGRQPFGTPRHPADTSNLGKSIRLTECAEHDPLRTAASVYLYVSDADALYAEWKALENLEAA